MKSESNFTPIVYTIEVQSYSLHFIYYFSSLVSTIISIIILSINTWNNIIYTFIELVDWSQFEWVKGKAETIGKIFAAICNEINWKPILMKNYKITTTLNDIFEWSLLLIYSLILYLIRCQTV